MANVSKLVESFAAEDDKVKALEAKLRVAKKRRAAVEVKLLKRMTSSVSPLDSVRVGKFLASIRAMTFITIKDRRKLNRFILKNKLPDLLQGRVSTELCKELLEDGVSHSTMGTDTVTVNKISLTRRS